MKIQDPIERQLLAGEYVLGTLEAAARVELETALIQDPALRADVRYWEARLAPLLARFQPQPAPERVWTALDLQINAAARPAVRSRPLLWQAWAGLATAASVLLSVALYFELSQPLPPPQIRTVEVPVQVREPMPYVAMFKAEQGDASWMVMITPERRRMKIRVAGNYPMPAADRALELWVIGDDGQPRSLGLLPMSGEHEMPMPADMPMPQQPLLAISLEPAGGSPTGLPTGPVLMSAPAIRAI